MNDVHCRQNIWKQVSVFVLKTDMNCIHIIVVFDFHGYIPFFSSYLWVLVDVIRANPFSLM